MKGIAPRKGMKALKGGEGVQLRGGLEVMESFPLGEFIREYSQALISGRAALFCGAGTSIPAGFINWHELLSDIADDLELKIDFVTDLISLAQYGENRRGRNRLNEKILNEFVGRAKANRLQAAIVRLPADEIWTTNYDHTLEEQYKNSGRTPDVKINEASLSIHLRRSDVSIYKMHGDVALPEEALLSKEDYELYAFSSRGQAFSVALQAALLSRTFLFLGFSFTDPNIDHIFSRVRVMMGKNRRTHYCIMRQPPTPASEDPRQRAQEEFNWRRTALQIEDLKRRYGIETILVKEYEQVAAIVEKLVVASNRKNVFVSGAFETYEPLGRPRIEKLLRSLGSRLESDGMTLISGMGLGVGAIVVAGFFISAYSRGEVSAPERATIRPFPQAVPGGGDLKAFWTAYRRDMLSRAGFAIYLGGNKAKGESVVPSDGMIEEFEIASSFGAIPVPVGATGHVAADLWQRVSASPHSYYPERADVSKPLATLGDQGASVEQLIDAVFKIITTVSAAYDE